jgi:hypothetical protein
MDELERIERAMAAQTILYHCSIQKDWAFLPMRRF